MGDFFASGYVDFFSLGMQIKMGKLVLGLGRGIGFVFFGLRDLGAMGGEFANLFLAGGFGIIGGSLGIVCPSFVICKKVNLCWLQRRILGWYFGYFYYKARIKLQKKKINMRLSFW